MTRSRILIVFGAPVQCAECAEYLYEEPRTDAELWVGDGDGYHHKRCIAPALDAAKARRKGQGGLWES